MALKSPRAMALLGFLLIHAGVPPRRDDIAAQIWPDCRQAQARASLRRELHALRARLPQVYPWLAAGREHDAQELAILPAMGAPLTAKYGYAATELQPILDHGPAELRGGP